MRATGGAFRIDHERGVTSTRMTVKVPCDRPGPALEVRRECEGTSEAFMTVDGGGLLSAYKGVVVHERLTLAPGGVLERALPAGASSARVSLTERPALSCRSAAARGRGAWCSARKTSRSRGDLAVTGKVHQG